MMFCWNEFSMKIFTNVWFQCGIHGMCRMWICSDGGVFYHVSLPLLVQNEAMTGVRSSNDVFSRLTFALYEDSGWVLNRRNNCPTFTTTPPSLVPCPSSFQLVWCGLQCCLLSEVWTVSWMWLCWKELLLIWVSGWPLTFVLFHLLLTCWVGLPIAINYTRMSRYYFFLLCVDWTGCHSAESRSPLPLITLVVGLEEQTQVALMTTWQLPPVILWMSILNSPYSTRYV